MDGKHKNTDRLNNVNSSPVTGGMKNNSDVDTQQSTSECVLQVCAHIGLTM